MQISPRDVLGHRKERIHGKVRVGGSTSSEHTTQGVRKLTKETDEAGHKKT